ncbi:MAG: protein kinase [Acidimicrobiia bacterium]|nr:protein kinase [Acidimicrobiia bacterium]
MSIAAPDLILGDRYQCLELLRAHRGMVTSLGQDLRDGAEVVLKVVHPSLVSSGARQRLEREAAVLRELGAPWLAPILDVGSDADRLWIVQPWIPGVPLSTHLPEGRKLTVDDVLTIARCVLTALVQVHEHGILHGHVRPGRVIVDPQFPITGATLIGCGLARNTLLGTSPGNEPAQTVRYLSPERVGLLDREVDERSDLYAVGIVLYECLAGRAPFTGRTVHEVLLQHVAAPPARLHELNIDVPPVSRTSSTDCSGRIPRSATRRLPRCWWSSRTWPGSWTGRRSRRAGSPRSPTASPGSPNPRSWLATRSSPRSRCSWSGRGRGPAAWSSSRGVGRGQDPTHGRVRAGRASGGVGAPRAGGRPGGPAAARAPRQGRG